jgi:L-ornithine Nalpha-acyltransferase
MNIAVIQGFEPSTLPRAVEALPELRDAGEFALGKLGTLTARLAVTKEEIRAAQELRHRVFFAGLPQGVNCRDEERFDARCDHLLVLDPSVHRAAERQIVGTYRLLRQECAGQAGAYCSQNEFDVESLISRHPDRHFLELSRSCVLPQYRSRRVAELLWQGIWAYCRMHAIDVMFGCASFPGTPPARHALQLSFLHHHARAIGAWSADPVSKLAVSTDLVPSEAINSRTALASMPPLVKGYLRLGAKFSGSAVIDPHFGTTDVLVVLRTEDISERYLNHYGREAERFA